MLYHQHKAEQNKCLHGSAYRPL